MGNQGTATLDFGAFPGATDASVVVTGQAGIVAGSLVEAWLFPTATADHSADEHLCEAIRIEAGNIVAATGFTIYGFAPENPGDGQVVQDARTMQSPRDGIRVYGQWTVAWVWN